jgi:AcrR family transcriptional regulator
MARAKLKRSESRQRDIIQAALDCFTEHGYEQTTMALIRRRSGASTGSIYHHFQSKDQLAAAVYMEGILDWQSGFVTELERHQGAKAGISAIIHYHLQWVRKNPDWARYLFRMRHLEFMSRVEADIHRINLKFFERIGAWFRRHIEAGRLKRLPRELFSSILLGPSQDAARSLLAGPSRLDFDRAARALSEAAWQSLKAR